jgi:heptosyltransferase-2
LTAPDAQSRAQRDSPQPSVWRRARRYLLDALRPVYLRVVCAPIAALQVEYALRKVRLAAPGPFRSAPRKVLVLCLDHLGDVAQALPFVLAARRAWPDAEFHVVASGPGAGIFEALPYCRVLRIPHREGRFYRWFRAPREHYGFARDNLWRLDLDLCVVARYDADYRCATLLGYFSRARWRAAFTEKALWQKAWHNRGYDRLLTHPAPPGGGLEPERILRLLDVLVASGGNAAGQLPRLEIPEAALSACRLPGGRRWVAICPSEGSSRLKQWGVDRWARVATELSALGFGVVVVGGGGDREAGRAVVRGAGPEGLDLTGRTSVPELIAVLSQCALLIGNDCGPVHVAALVDCPTVVLMGSTCAHRYAPWSTRAEAITRILPCSPCYDHSSRPERCRVCIYSAPLCLSAVGPSEVVAAARRLLRVASDVSAQVPMAAGNPRG